MERQDGPNRGLEIFGRGRRMVRELNIDGDGQGDLAGHGGEQRAVFVYQMDSYQYWERFLGRADFGFGQFGKNFTVEGPADNEGCIGDRYRIGDAVFEVTQPRVTCYLVAPAVPSNARHEVSAARIPMNRRVTCACAFRIDP